MSWIKPKPPETPRRRSVEPTNAVNEPTLPELESIVDAGLDSIGNVGQALFAIKDRELFKPQYATFGEYTEARWKMSGDYAERLIRAGVVVLKIKAAGLAEPTHTSHARALATVPDEAVTKVWQESLDAVGGNPEAITAEVVAGKAAKHRKRKARRKAPAAIRLKGKGWAIVIARKSIDLDPNKILAEAIEQLTQQAAKKVA